jgi:hypothetical protein
LRDENAQRQIRNDAGGETAKKKSQPTMPVENRAVKASRIEHRK